ncbi:MAG: beta-lactamase family protein [bacterium]|nr:beta-lactamase family protein [bacterium]
MRATREKLEDILQEQIKHKQIFNVVLAVQSGNNSFEWSGAAGIARPGKNTEMRTGSPYFIASITKMFTAVAIMLLHEQKKLDLEDPIATYFSSGQIEGIHHFRGKDYVGELKIYHLVSHTSGLADYFEQKNSQGKTLLDNIIEHGDAEWDVEKVLDVVKNDLTPKFPPAITQGSHHKAYYSDTNYQLLGAILENVLEKSLGRIFDELFFTPLDLPNTYVYGDDVAGSRREIPATIYYNKTPLNLPKAMRSFWSDGAIVSTAEEQITLLKELFGGKIFKEENTLKWMKQWNKIFFPLEYGYGLMRYKLPWFFSPFSQIPEFIGHSGASGSFAFYCPKQDFYLSGTINQLQARSTSFRLLPRIANTLKEEKT